MENRPVHYQRVWGYYDKNLFRSMFKSLGTLNSFVEYRTHPFIQKYLDSLSSVAPMVDVSTQTQVLFHLYQMYMNGEKILQVEYDLALQLFHTEIRGVRAGHLKAPFKEQYIAVPHGIQTIQRPGKGEHKVEGIYVFLNRLEKGKQELRIMTIGTANENVQNKMDDAITFLRIYLDDLDEIQEAVNKAMKDSLIEPESIIADGEYNHNKLPSIINFVVNVLLYSTSPGADIHWQSWMDIDPKIKKLSGKKLEERKAELRRKHILSGVLGGNIKLRHEERELYLGHMQNTGRPIGVAVLVRGHWRNQWYGSEAEGTRIQKPKFIEPFWKGMNSDIISNKIVLLD